MDSSSRKRKLSEIDKNLPLFPNLFSNSKTILGDSLKINFKSTLKLPKLITPSKGFENYIQPVSKDEEFDNSKTQGCHENKNNAANKTGVKNNAKACEKKPKKIIVGDKFKNEGLLLNTIQPSKLEIPYWSCCNLSEKNDVKNDSNLSTLVDDAVTKEVKMWFACDYMEDILSHEFRKERGYKLSDDFCKKYDIDPERREILIEWLISVQLHLKAGNNTLHLAVTLLDILLDKIYIPYKMLQVSAIAAFWVAYKFIHGNLSVKTLISLCAGIPTRDIILDHEVLILQSSELLQAGGDMSTFFNYLLFKLFGDKFPPEIYYCGQYFLEIMIFQFMFVDCLACEKAITAVYVSLAVFESALRFKLFEYNRFISKKKLQHMCEHLLRLLKFMYSNDDILKNSGLFRKYKSSRYFRISTHCNLKALSSISSTTPEINL